MSTGPERGTMESTMRWPFGTYRGVPIPELRTSYLEWILDKDLSPSLRRIVAGELSRRGITPPPAPPPQPGTCPKCGPAAPVGYAWFRDSLDRAHIRARCLRCGGSLGNVPQVEPFLGLAGPAPAGRVSP
jgi:hypothetical protein